MSASGCPLLSFSCGGRPCACRRSVCPCRRSCSGRWRRPPRRPIPPQPGRNSRSSSFSSWSPVVAGAFRTVGSARRLTEAWFVIASIAVSVGVFQFVRSALRISASGRDFTEAYVVDRITGFFSHWMTFSQAVLVVFVALVSYLAFAKRRPGFGVWRLLAGWLAAGLALSYTRSVWLALVAAGLYFVAVCRPRALLLVPAVLGRGVLSGAAVDTGTGRLRSTSRPTRRASSCGGPGCA